MIDRSFIRTPLLNPEVKTALEKVIDFVEPEGRSVREFNIVPLPSYDTRTDQTTRIESALDSGERLIWPAGYYNVDGSFSGISGSLHGVPGKSIIRVLTNDGDDCRWDFSGVDDLTIYGLTWHVVNTPFDSINNAAETAAILRLTNCSNVKVHRCEFKNIYGTAVIFRNVEGGEITRNRIVTAYKDGFHITGTSKYITRTGNIVINGGDDALAVVGYTEGSGAGQPEHITDIGNIVRGVKFSRGIAYVGVKHVVCQGNQIDGTVPAEYSPSSSHYCRSGLLIFSDSSVNAYHNEDIQCIGNVIKNCGASNYGAVQINGRSAGTTPSSNISLIKTRVENFPRYGVVIDGLAAGRLRDVTLEKLDVVQGDDPNSRGGSGAGASPAILIGYGTNTTVEGSVSEAGGAACLVQGSSAGSPDGDLAIDLTTRNINKSGSAGVDILTVLANCAADLDIVLRVAEQPDASSGAYSLDRMVDMSTNPKIRRFVVIDQTSPGIADTVLWTGVSSLETITPTGSPFTWANKYTCPVMVRVTGGTVSLVERVSGKFDLTVSGSDVVHTFTATSAWVEPVPGKVQGYWLIQPGQAIRVTYTGAPSMSAISTVS